MITKSYNIAIHPDDYTSKGAEPLSDSSSSWWIPMLESAGHEVTVVNIHSPDIVEQLRRFDGLMWRWAHSRGMGRLARRLLPVVERDLGLVVYPNQKTCWHYDDKISQYYLFQALNVPTPQTWVWFEREPAKEWALTADYPIVLKLTNGAGSTNVRIIQNSQEAHQWIDRLFTYRVRSLYDIKRKNDTWVRNIKRRIRGISPLLFDDGFELQSGYVYFQEFLSGNKFDTRITVIGDDIYVFRRHNRDDDFRASGSGKIEYISDCYDQDLVDMSHTISKQLGLQSCAFDWLRRGEQPVVGEISYTYVSESVFRCPGHWRFTENGKQKEYFLGQKRPEVSQIEVFLNQLSERFS